VSSCLSPPAQSDTAIGTNVITIHLAIIYHQLPAVLYITVINPLIEKDPLPQCLVWMLLLYVTPGYITTAKLSFKTSYSVFLIFRTCSLSYCFLHALFTRHIKHRSQLERRDTRGSVRLSLLSLFPFRFSGNILAGKFSSPVWVLSLSYHLISSHLSPSSPTRSSNVIRRTAFVYFVHLLNITHAGLYRLNFMLFVPCFIDTNSRH